MLANFCQRSGGYDLRGVEVVDWPYLLTYAKRRGQSYTGNARNQGMYMFNVPTTTHVAPARLDTRPGSTTLYISDLNIAAKMFPHPNDPN